MNSTGIAMIFVDPAMRVTVFTPRARPLLNIIPTDTAQPLLDITSELRYPQLIDDIGEALDTLSVREREVESSDGCWYIARILPCQTADDRLAGVVLMFTEIALRKRVEQALRESEERLRLVIESMPDLAIVTLDPDGRIQSWTQGAQQMFGYAADEAIGQDMAIVFPAEDRAAGVPRSEMVEAREKGRAVDERWHVRKDGSRLFVRGILAPLVADGKLLGYTKIARDLTFGQRAEEELRRIREDLEARVEERTRELAEANEALKRQIAERTDAEETRLRLLRQLVRAQEDERRRISRELHDQLGQDVTALGLKLSSLKGRSDVSSEARSLIEGIEDLVKELDSDVEFLVWKLRPTGLDDLGLADALSDYAASWSRMFGAAAHFHSNLSKRLLAEIETVLYRIAQEALNNVAKHAKASHVEVLLEQEAGSVTLTVQDDGVGFDTAAPIDPRSLGLISMRERAALVSGSVSIVSRAGTGTVVRVVVPM